ncbi:hypothetical protein AB0J74_28905 [Asanoa sp. NPDC049573]|uniref:hypothetical protein n=1 Tax=Asanoa sp. NPDC049573 TaxID=3155396 RepID=UPI00343C4AE2
MRRRIITALVAGAATALLAGCGALGSEPSAPATTAPPSAREKLAASVPDGSAGRYAFSFKDGESNTSGVVDPKSQRISMTTSYKEKDLGFTLTMSYLVIKKDQWVKISFDKKLPGLPQLPKKWLRLDTSKVKDDPFTNLEDPDPVAAADLFDAIVKVSEDKPGTFTGTLDLTKATVASIVDDDGLKALGAKAEAVPFTATLDDAGRLATIDIKVPGYAKVKAFTHHATYSEYGSAPEVNAPAASASQDAPAAAYDLLNS